MVLFLPRPSYSFLSLRPAAVYSAPFSSSAPLSLDLNRLPFSAVLPLPPHVLSSAVPPRRGRLRVPHRDRIDTHSVVPKGPSLLATPILKPLVNTTKMEAQREGTITLGVCALDRKARSKPMQNILNRILANKELDVSIVNFGDKVILDEPAESWPVVDVLISFFSAGFPLDKAISYANLRKPICVNDLGLQKVLWDRRAVLAILDAVKVPTPRRLEVDRDGGPEVEEELGKDLKRRLGVDLLRRRPIKDCYLKDEDTLVVGNQEIRKPYVEKPVSGEDHNIHIYFPRSMGGGGRRLFRKVGNKSSEHDPNLVEPRKEGSYIYEEFISVDNAEDVKVYTIGPKFVHAETRKSPVVDGLVKRNPDGKEIRYITKLSEPEVTMAENISTAFKQNICGFDLLRVGNKSYVIDVNGWSFVKGNDFYYDKCAEILGNFCKHNVPPVRTLSSGGDTGSTSEQSQASWNLKATVTVFRHGDRTPKQKLKRSFKAKDSWTAPLIDLLQGRREEIILRQQLDLVSTAAEEARKLEGAHTEDLDLVIDVINRKKEMPGTKVQMKPAFKDGKLDKMTLIVKWGGEFSHAARHQAKDYGQNMRRDMMIMCPKALKNCTIYTSSERRVTASAEIFAASFLDDPEEPSQKPLQLVIRKDLLDDSNAAKEDMDIVKKSLKASLRADGVDAQKRPEHWPEDMAPPAELARQIAAILSHLSKVMKQNFQSLDVEKIQKRWCTHETPKLFRERWEKLFADYEEEPSDPSRTSELADMLSHDGLHNRPFLEAIFSDPAETDAKKKLEQLHELYRMSCVLFHYVCPREYGIELDQKERIGLLTSMPLMRNIVSDLERAEEGSLCSLYFTKESHVHTLLNLILASDLPIVMPRMPPLDYFSSITFEVFEKTPSITGGANSTSASPRPSHDAGSAAASERAPSPTSTTPATRPERSLLITVSEGAFSSNILSIDLDARHSIHPLPRRALTQHIELSEALSKLSAHALSVEDSKMLARGQIEGAAVFFGEKEAESEHGLLPVNKASFSHSQASSIQGEATASSSPPTPPKQKTTQPVVLCGPSGVGKSTLIKRLFAEFPDEYGFSVSHTTRAPRPGEIPGYHYHYVTRAEFEDLVSKGAFLEYATFGGNMYGTTIAAVEAVSKEKGKRAILDIDAQGVKLLKANHAHLDPLYLFVSPPKLGALYERLKNRGTETPESTLKRLSMAAGEMAYARADGGRNFDVVVVNDDLDRAYQVFKGAIRGAEEAGGKGDVMPVEEEEGSVLEQARKEVEDAKASS